jgi:hypothetical protein
MEQQGHRGHGERCEDGVAGLMVKEYALRGKVRVMWSAM